MKIFHFVMLLAVMVCLSFFSSLAQADSYSNAVDVFKKSPAVQSFF